MKKLKFAALALLGLSTVFTSCEDDGTVIPGPTVIIETPTGTPNVEPGGSVFVSVTASTNDKLESLEVYSVFAGLESPILDSTLESGVTSFTYEAMLPVATQEGVQEFFFVFTNNKGGATTKSFTVNVAPFPTGTVWNIQGPNKGAFDLVAGVEVGASQPEANKDLKDNSEVVAGVVVFNAQWESGNGTMFVEANIDFNSVTVAEAGAAFEAGNAQATTPTLSAGDVIVAKNSRFPQGYAVIRIDQVSNTPADNLDNIVFTYKK